MRKTRWIAGLLAAVLLLALLPVQALAAETSGWVLTDGVWTYLDEAGELARNEWRDGCWLNADGSWTYAPRGSWQRDGVGWWYGDTSGWYARNAWVKIDGSWYYFDGSGYMAADEFRQGYVLNEDGTWTDQSRFRWDNFDGYWYYGDGESRCVINWAKIDGVWYYFDQTGRMARNEWRDGCWLNADGSWTYAAKGAWNQSASGWWFGDSTGWYVHDAWQKIDGSWYYFNGSGYMLRNTMVGGYCLESDGHWSGVVIYNTVGGYEADLYFSDTEYQHITGIDLSLASGHSHYSNETTMQALESDTMAKYFADEILADPELTTDLDRVAQAALIVRSFSMQCEYDQDDARHYRSPYGVFFGGVYTCAGTARALGRILDYMGFSWTHVNENENHHQWCELIMDGQAGFADGMAGVADYGDAETGFASRGIFIF